MDNLEILETLGQEAIKNGQSRDTGNIGHTIHMTEKNQNNNNQTKNKKNNKNNQMSNTDRQTFWELTQVLAKGKRFLLLIRHLPYYSFSHLRSCANSHTLVFLKYCVEQTI